MRVSNSLEDFGAPLDGWYVRFSVLPKTPRLVLFVSTHGGMTA